MPLPARERLATRGAASLSEAELLALALRPAGARRPPVGAASILLERYGGLARVLNTRAEEVATVPGVGAGGAAQLAVARELARRAIEEQMRQRDSLESPAAVRDYLRLALGPLGHEVFWVAFLDARNRVLATEELFRGTLTQTSVYPREVVKRALAHNAASVILAHNHPSGVAEPSFQDQALTRALTEALALVDIRVVDHFIVAPGASLSFAERGLL